MRLVFFGTPAVAVPTLDALVAAGHDVALVITQPDKRRGRSSALLASSVKAAAERLDIPVSHTVKDSITVNADLGVLVAFGRLIKPEILDELNIINLHPSLLPRWRGATPVEGAILGGDTQTGICLMQLVQAMDEGPVYARYQTPIEHDEKAGLLYERLFEAGNKLLLELLSADELPEPAAQEGEPTYCGKISPDDLHIDWTKPAEEVVRLTRVGRAWTTFRGKRFIVIDASATTESVDGEPGTFEGACVKAGQNVVILRTVQPEGKGPQDASAWVNGARLEAGEKLT